MQRLAPPWCELLTSSRDLRQAADPRFESLESDHLPMPGKVVWQLPKMEKSMIMS